MIAIAIETVTETVGKDPVQDPDPDRMPKRVTKTGIEVGKIEVTEIVIGTTIKTITGKDPHLINVAAIEVTKGRKNPT